MSLAPNDLVDGKYRIVRLIGDGGMGSVYEARHEFLGIPVALKFLHTDLAKRPGLAARFLQEARVSATIQSVHVCHVTDVDTAVDGSPFLVMELLNGESLQSLLTRQGKLQVDQSLGFTLQILAGLEAAHALGVVHRDLKPDNVFVTPSPSGPLLKLIDFGIAKLRETNEFKKELTRAGVIMGTPEYMAPEQLYAAHEVDHRADLYSLGVILFEMLSGTRPADGDSAEGIIASIVGGTGKKLGALDPSLPPALVRLVERALSADRNGRFASAYEMRVEVARCAGELGHPGRLAATSAPVPALASHTHPDGPVPSSTDRKFPDTVDAARDKGARLPRTLPPDDGETRSTGTQAAPPPVGPRSPWAAPPNTPARRERKGHTGWWLFAVVIVLGLGVGAVYAVQMLLPTRHTIPELPPFEPPPVTGAGQSIDIQPTETAPPETARPSNPRPAVPLSPMAPRPRANSPGNPGATSGGAPGLPLPFPSIALPSSLPRLPFPPGFPSALPSFLPQIPGLTVPATPTAGAAAQ